MSGEIRLPAVAASPILADVFQTASLLSSASADALAAALISGVRI